MRSAHSRARLSARVDGEALSAVRAYALRWELPLSAIVESALREFVERREVQDLGPLPLGTRTRRGPPSRSQAIADAAAFLRLAKRGGRNLRE
ncbi:MAG: hypothetical protein KGJ98_10570 [Chloroflexota bacterium]|nr:hypothetical protein [Chloroflexota bacterium]